MTPSPGSADLRFGAGLLGHYSRAYPVSRVAELGALCERLGFDSYWIADQRWMRDVWVSLSATALRTSRIQLGTRVTDPYVRHPALTAVAVASLDELSGGRAILGLGAGGSGFREMGIERTKPVTALREAIELIRRLLAGEEVDYAGELVRFRRGALEFATRRDIPVVVVARGPRILELGGRVADGVMIASMASAAAVSWGDRARPGRHAASGPAGGSRRAVVDALHVHLGRWPGRALDRSPRDRRRAHGQFPELRLPGGQRPHGASGAPGRSFRLASRTTRG